MLKTESVIEVKHNEPIYLIPFGDLHYGHRDSNILEFKRMLKENKNEDSYFIGLGDIFDSIIQSDIRFQISQLSGMERGPLIDDLMDHYVKEFTKMWKEFDISQKVLLMGIGNHEENMQRRYGTNPTKRFCESEGINYGAYSGYHTVLLRNKSWAGALNIFYHHGYGGGARSGGYPITKYEREMMWSDADIFLFGHDHRRHLQPYSYIKCSTNGQFLYKTRRVLAICGGFLENRPVTEYPSYAEIKMYPATDIGYIKIPIVVHSRRLGEKSADVRRIIEFPIFEK